MKKEVEKVEMTSSQLFTFSTQTCQWWNAVFIQAKRFMDDLEHNDGGTPWDEKNENNMLVADRMFFITTLHHAIENLQKLNIELQRNDDNTFQSVLDAIASVAPIENIKNLRDMNEHILDYLVNKGKKQDEFIKEVEINDQYKIHTTPAWTHINGELHAIMLGDVEINKLLTVMKEQHPIVKSKTKEIFEKSLYGQ